MITSQELHDRVERGENIVVVDSRTPEEFAAFSLPFAHSLPGAELVYRIAEIAPDPDTFVVVNCAGRTRSIVGAQTLIDAGISGSGLFAQRHHGLASRAAPWPTVVLPPCPSHQL